ncbi:ArnT family glycosyltransferase [Cohnella herbarum]|uniref:Glycosyltransferase family 39 protein n=1 Tax=Cohnella herbarum TaxID=2728023 RepID=A0A7Z2VJ59_9BACL|nr:glycosyltransferase family 39 protein [Cohnella herbarum]QJD84228.1 glycosyltransferase family 39 protein [Cohnella herbarum]
MILLKRLKLNEWSRIVLLLIMLVAAFLRFDFLVSVNHHNSHDTVNYDIMVRQLLEEGVYAYKSTEPNAQVSPGFPLFMAAVYKLIDYKHNDPYSAIRFLQAIFSLITLWLTYRIAKRLGGEWAGLLAATMMAIYPPFIWTTGAVLTETIATMFFMAYLYFQLIAFDKTHRWAALWAGVALGLTALTRPEFLIIAPASYFLYLLWHRKGAQMMKLLLSTGLGMAIVMSPWLVRNIVALHEPIFTSTQVNPFAAGTYPNKNYDDNLVDRTGKTQMEVAKERLKVGFTEHTWTFVKWYTIGKLDRIYSKMFGGSGHKPIYPVIPYRAYFHLLLIYAGLIAAAVTLRNWRQPAMLIVFLLAAISAARLAFVPEYRYNFTAMPQIIVLDSLLVIWIFVWLDKRFQLKSRLLLARRNEHARNDV